MAKAENDMIRDILGWAISDEQKLALIRQIAGLQAAPAPAKPVPAHARKHGGHRKPTKAAAPAPAPAPEPAPAPAPAPAKVVKRRKRSALRPEGSGYTRRSLLWAELKRLAPEKLAGLRYTKVSTEQLEPMVAEARLGK